MSQFVESIRYEADISDLKAKLDRIEGKNRDLADGSESMGRRMAGAFGSATKKVAMLGVGLGVAAAAVAVKFGPALLNAGVALEAMDVKAATVFSGSSLAKVQAWADGIASSLGLTNTQAIALAANTADLLKPMGFSADAAAEMATKTNDLAGALGAWSQGKFSSAEASEILTKAYLGEREGLKQLGISILESDVQARLAAKGQSELTGAALEQAKAMATMELIFEKSTDAQEAWSNGSMDAVKAQNEGRAALERLKEGFTRLLYPALAKVLPIATRFVDWAGEHAPAALAVVGRFIQDKVVPVLDRLGEWLGKNIPRAVVVLRGYYQRFLVPAFEKVSAIARELGQVLARVGQWMMDNKPTVAAFAATLGTLLILNTIAKAVMAFNAALALNPIVLIAVAIAALVAGLVYAYTHFESFRNIVDTVLAAVRTAFQWTVEKAQEFWDRSEGLRSWLAAAFTATLDAIVVTWGAVSTAVQAVWSWLQNLWDRSEGLRAFLAGAVKAAIDGHVLAWQIVRSTIETVWSWLQTLWDRTEGLRAFLAGAVETALRTYIGTWRAVWTVIEVVWGWLQVLWDRSEGLRSFLSNAFVVALSVVRTTIDLVWKALRTAWEWLQTLWDKGVELVGFLEGAFDAGFQAAKTAIGYVLGPLQSVINKLVTIIEKAKSAIEWLKKLNPLNAGASIQLPPGLQAAIESGNYTPGAGVPQRLAFNPLAAIPTTIPAATPGSPRASRIAGGNTYTINVYGSDRRFARWISDEIRRYEEEAA